MLASFLKRDLRNLIQRDASPNFQDQNGLLLLRSWWRSVRSLWERPGLRAPHGANSTNATIPLAPRGLHAGRSAPSSEQPGRSTLLFPPGNTCNALDRDGRTRSRDDAPSTVSHACWSLAA